jgi:hypothetical protein
MEMTQNVNTNNIFNLDPFMFLLVVFAIRQFVNTRNIHRPLHVARRIMSDDAMQDEMSSSGDEELPTPNYTTGTILAEFNPTFGVDLFSDNESLDFTIGLRTSALKSDLICRCFTGDSWMYAQKSHYTYSRVFDGVGAILEVFIMLVITGAITGICPINISIDLKVSWLVGRVTCQDIDNEDDEDEGEHPANQLRAPPCTTRAKCVWLSFSVLLAMSLSGLTSHILLVAPQRWVFT